MAHSQKWILLSIIPGQLLEANQVRSCIDWRTELDAQLYDWWLEISGGFKDSVCFKFLICEVCGGLDAPVDSL